MKILVVAAHPDDEVLGAGGTIAHLASTMGAGVTTLILAEGVITRRPGLTIKDGQRMCEAAAKVLGVHELRFGGFGSNCLLGDGPQQAIVESVARCLVDVAPDTVMTHHPGDIHIDHRITANCVSYATRLLGLSSVREVLHFEVTSSTDQYVAAASPFLPSVYYDVGETLDTKCAAFEAYPTEVCAPPHPRSNHGIRALATYRGAQVGIDVAEAFVLGRALRR